MLQSYSIFTTTGLLLYEFPVSSNVDIELFGALIQALNLCCQESLHKELYDFGTSTDRYIIHRRSDWELYIIGKVNRVDSDEIIIPRLQHILAQFEKRFHTELKHFNNNVTPFADFEYNLPKDNLKDLLFDSTIALTSSN